jgi:hypothetical protein
LGIYRAIDSRPEIARLEHNFGYLALHAGDLNRARPHFSASLPLFQVAGIRRGVAEGIAGCAALAAERDPHCAARLWGAADAIHRAEGTPIWPADRAERTRYEPLARKTLGDDEYERAYAAGAALTLDQAVDEVLRV